MRVVVVGGGVIGLACADALVERGAEVVLVERDECGKAASAGNAGWVTRGLSAPLAAPGVTWQTLRWMLRPDSPFLLRPRADPGFLRWCWEFWRNCAAERYEAGAKALVALNRQTPALYAKLADRGIAYEEHRTGLLLAARTKRAVEEYATAFQGLAKLGYEEEIEHLDGPSIRAMEPALSPDVVGGLYVRSDWHLRPETLTQALTESLRARGARIVEGTAAEALTRVNGGWTVRGSEHQEFSGDAVVIAGGAWTATLLREHGIRVPLEAAKGYSVTADGVGTAPSRALYLMETKVGFTPFAKAMRLAGTLELAGLDLSLTQRRVAPLLAAAAGYLRDWRPRMPFAVWTGFRPLAPDGLPIVGPVPGLDGAYVATGHGMLGITLAPATAAGVAALVVDGRTPEELAPLALSRFDRTPAGFRSPRQ